MAVAALAATVATARPGRTPGSTKATSRRSVREPSSTITARGDVRVGNQGGLDLGELDPVPPDLDLGVLPAEELDVAVRQVAAQVPGAVEPLRRTRMSTNRSAVRTGSPR